MMNLLIDRGNTRTKWAVAEPAGRIVEVGVAEPTEAWIDALMCRYQLTRAICSSTRGAMMDVATLLQGRLDDVLWFTAETPVPIGIDYRTPETLGRDRVAAAVGAMTLYGGRNCLVVDFGTALTIDLVTADGVFRGGTISLGLTSRFRALEAFTAGLPLCEPSDNMTLQGKSTREAIEQGVMHSVSFELEGYIARMEDKFSDLCVIFTGGEAKYFVKRIKNTIFAEPNLVFCGLNRILEYNATTKK